MRAVEIKAGNRVLGYRKWGVGGWAETVRHKEAFLPM